MDFALIQSRRRLQSVLEKKREEARRRKAEAARQAAEDAAEEAERQRVAAVEKKKRQVENLLVMIEQGIRTFGYTVGVSTTQIRNWFAKTYAGTKLNDELFRKALRKGIEERRLKHGTTRRKELDVNSYLINEEVCVSLGDFLSCTTVVAERQRERRCGRAWMFTCMCALHACTMLCVQMDKPPDAVEGVANQLKAAAKQKRFIQPLIVGFWFLVWTSMELNQDLSLIHI